MPGAVYQNFKCICNKVCQSSPPLFFSFKFIIYLCLLGLLCCMGFFLAVASRGSSLLTACRLFMQWLLLWNMSFRVTGLLWFWLPGSRAQAQKAWSMGLVALRHVASSRTRDRAHVSCIGRQILCCWATWEPLPWFSWIYFLLVLLQVFNPLGINFVFFHIVLQLLSSSHQIFHTFPPALKFLLHHMLKSPHCSVSQVCWFIAALKSHCFHYSSFILPSLYCIVFIFFRNSNWGYPEFCGGRGFGGSLWLSW